MYLIRPKLLLRHLGGLLAALAVAGCPASSPGRVDAGDRRAHVRPSGAGGSTEASSRSDATTTGAEPPLPFDPKDDRLDVVGAWAMEAPKPGAGGDRPPGERIAHDLDVSEQPWPVPLNGSLRIELWQRLADFRVRLLDSAGRLLPHEALVGQVPSRRRGGHVEPGGTWVEVTPRGGFPPGRPVRLVIDGENGPRPLDIQGRGYQDLVLDAIGDSPPAPSAPADGSAAGIGEERLP